MRKTGITALAAAALAVVGGTSSAGAETVAAHGPVLEEHVTTRTVLQGALPHVRGNQHRLTYFTDTEGMQWPAASMKIQSYFCPSSARITSRWTSSRCTHRATSFIRYDRSNYRVSSTMRSAVITGTLRSGTKRWEADLRLFADGEAKTSSMGPDAIVRYVGAKVSGTVGGTPVRSDQREDSSIHRLERR